MGLEDDQQQDVWNRKVSDTGEENDTQRQSVATPASQTKVKTWRSSNHDQACADKEDTDSSQDQQSPNLPLGCKTFLLTQAATLAGSAITDPSLFSYGLANKVTPASVALESPSSPPVACAASPASHSIDSPSHQTSCSYASSPTTKSTLRKRGVPHIYRDFTNVPDTSGYVRKKTGGVTQPFPEKLHEMLDQVDEPNMVGWLPHGRAFIVRKPKEFTAQIMPKFFRQSKLTSFQRQ